MQDTGWKPMLHCSLASPTLDITRARSGGARPGSQKTWESKPRKPDSFSPVQVAPVELAEPDVPLGKVEYFEVDLSDLAQLVEVLYQIPHALCETRSYPDLNPAQAREASLRRTERVRSQGSIPTQSDLALP